MKRFLALRPPTISTVAISDKVLNFQQAERVKVPPLRIYEQYAQTSRELGTTISDLRGLLLELTSAPLSVIKLAYKEFSGMMTAAILAKRTNTPIFTIRHYTRIGLLKPSRDLRNGYRIYKPSDKDRLKFINAAKHLGFTLAEIEEILDHAAHSNSPCPMVREIVEKRIDENQKKIREMQRLQKRLENAAKMWKTMKNSEPDGHSVCRLIESFAESDAEA